MNKKYMVKLKNEEWGKLNELTHKGKEKVRKLKRCQILLISGEGKSDAEIAKVLKVSTGTAANIRRRYANGGLESALNEKRRLELPRNTKDWKVPKSRLWPVQHRPKAVVVGRFGYGLIKQ